MLEMSTLTGAILVALVKSIGLFYIFEKGTKTAGLFSNNDELVKDLLQAGKEANEIMWHMPIFDEHRDYMKREHCDLNNLSGSLKNFFFYLWQFFIKEMGWLLLCCCLLREFRRKGC